MSECKRFLGQCGRAPARRSFAYDLRHMLVDLMTEFNLPENLEDPQAMSLWGANMTAHFEKTNRPKGTAAVQSILALYGDDAPEDEAEIEAIVVEASQTILRENLQGTAEIYSALIEPTKEESLSDGLNATQKDSLKKAVRVYELVSDLYAKAADAVGPGESAAMEVQKAVTAAQNELRELGVL